MEMQKFNERRKFTRKEADGKVIIYFEDHNGRLVVSCTVRDLCRGGIGILGESARLFRGAMVSIEVACIKGLTPFQTKGRIVSMESDFRGDRSNTKIGIEFTQLSTLVNRQLTSLLG